MKLSLRLTKEGDARGIYLASKNNLTMYSKFRIDSVSDAQEYIYKRSNKLLYSMIADGEVVGWVLLSSICNRCCTISYCLRKDMQGKGIATRMVRIALIKGMILGIRSFIAKVLNDNPKSSGVVTRLGFIPLAHETVYFASKRQDMIGYYADWRLIIGRIARDKLLGEAYRRQSSQKTENVLP